MVYTYKEFVLYMATYPVISSMLIVQGNPMFGMPAKHILHSIVVGVVYYNFLFDSGH